MKQLRTGLLLVAVTISACAIDAGGIDLPGKDDSPVLQVQSEGGFAPVEFVLGRGPRYTLLADGRLISEGPVIAIFPGPLVPNYQVVSISDDQMRSVLEAVDRMGLPEMTNEMDDSAASRVADATTEVVTYWDDAGVHRYSVYALGIDIDVPRRAETQAFGDLLNLLDQLVASGNDPGPYVADQVQYVAGPGFADLSSDLREWPLANSDFSGWKTLPNGWMCQVQPGTVPAVFDDATVETQWAHPETGEPMKLLVRPRLPGEEICFGN